MELIFLKPILKHNIWGNVKLREEYGYNEEGNDIGECWGISAHKNGDCVVRNGLYKEMHLSELLNQKTEIFGKEKNQDIFPLLVKIIDAKDDLSIQVHPDDDYAKIYENGSLGKTECWYILDCKENAELVVGHNAKTHDELCEMINNHRWNEFIRTIPVHKGDFIQIEPGTVHAIKGGITLLETQQNSDITYRVYDYNRLSNGKPRELHIEKSIGVITVPAKASEESVLSTKKFPKNTLNLMHSCKYYNVYLLEVTDRAEINIEYPYFLMSVVSGTGSLKGYKIKKGDHFIVPNGFGKLEFEGEMTIVCSNEFTK